MNECRRIRDHLPIHPLHCRLFFMQTPVDECERPRCWTGHKKSTRLATKRLKGSMRYLAETVKHQTNVLSTPPPPYGRDADTTPRKPGAGRRFTLHVHAATPILFMETTNLLTDYTSETLPSHLRPPFRRRNARLGTRGLVWRFAPPFFTHIRSTRVNRNLAEQIRFSLSYVETIVTPHDTHTHRYIRYLYTTTSNLFHHNPAHPICFTNYRTSVTSWPGWAPQRAEASLPPPSRGSAASMSIPSTSAGWKVSLEASITACSAASIFSR